MPSSLCCCSNRNNMSFVSCFMYLSLSSAVPWYRHWGIDVCRKFIKFPAKTAHIPQKLPFFVILSQKTSFSAVTFHFFAYYKGRMSNFSPIILLHGIFLDSSYPLLGVFLPSSYPTERVGSASRKSLLALSKVSACSRPPLSSAYATPILRLRYALATI